MKITAIGCPVCASPMILAVEDRELYAVCPEGCSAREIDDVIRKVKEDDTYFQPPVSKELQ